MLLQLHKELDDDDDIFALFVYGQLTFKKL